MTPCDLATDIIKSFKLFKSFLIYFISTILFAFVDAWLVSRSKNNTKKYVYTLVGISMLSGCIVTALLYIFTSCSHRTAVVVHGKYLQPLQSHYRPRNILFNRSDCVKTNLVIKTSWWLQLMAKRLIFFFFEKTDSEMNGLVLYAN